MLDRNSVVEQSKKETDIHAHLLTLYSLVENLKAQVVVEVGAGESTYALTAAVNATGGQFWSIDSCPIAFNRQGYHADEELKNQPRLHIICENDMEVVKGWTKPIDLLFLDSSHQYQHTLDELRAWTPFIRVGGVLVMHDTAHTGGHAGGCRVALDEFLKKNPGLYSAEHRANCNGLSILTKLKEL